MITSQVQMLNKFSISSTNSMRLTILLEIISNKWDHTKEMPMTSLKLFKDTQVCHNINTNTMCPSQMIRAMKNMMNIVINLKVVVSKNTEWLQLKKTDNKLVLQKLPIS